MGAPTRRPVLLAAAALATAAAAAAAIGFGFGVSPVTDRLTQNQENWDTCARIRETGIQADCISEILATFTSSSSAGAALAAATDAHPGLWAACHPASHTAGASQDRAQEQLLELLDNPTAAAACDWGLTHGLLARIETDGAGRSRLLELAQACTSTDQQFETACADSFGHALFEANRDFTATVTDCRNIGSRAAADACISGSFMQLYLPVAPSRTWSGPPEQDTLIALCAALTTDDQRACARAAHYAAASTLRTAIGSALLAEREGADLLARYRASIPGAVDDGLDFCDRFENGGELCAQWFLAYAVSALRDVPGDEITTLVCNQARNRTHEDLCRQRITEL